MTLLHIVVLAIIQGLTEFLPVSSSAHLILGSRLFGWPDQGLVFDVATHLGTLCAVLVYFRHDLAQLLRAVFVPPRTASERRHRSLAICLVWASLPALAIGAFAAHAVEQSLRNLHVIAWATVVFALLLWLADALGRRTRSLEDMKLPHAVLVGLAQALALVPGTSRSGVTITMARALGYSPEAAARFSFLLAVPVLAAAGGYGVLRVVTGESNIDWQVFGLGLVLSAGAGWVCIAAFLALLRRFGLGPFIAYRLALGALLLWLAG